MNSKLESKIDRLRSIFTAPRIKILRHLIKGKSCVCEMVEQLSIKHNLLSYHLGVLVDEGLLDSHRNGRHITYNIKKTRVTCVKKIFSLVDFENCH